MDIKEENYSLLFGDCLDRMADIPDGSVDLIITSPPYADARKGIYGGTHPDRYVEWFYPYAKEMRRVLSPTGSFLLNIKEKVVSGERHPYVLELILALRSEGWLWTEEYIWHKKDAVPGKWPNRFRDAWERCLHFTKAKVFTMNQDAVMVPAAAATTARALRLSSLDKTRQNSKTGSGFGVNREKSCARNMVYPTNVIYSATDSSKNINHPAVFPPSIPNWFIRLFSNSGDIILDPFAGSGTTGVAAFNLGRRFIGIEKDFDFFKIAGERIKSAVKEQT